MKLALLTIIALAGLQFALAQNVTDCTDIAAGLETIAIDPITGEHLNMLWIELHVAIILTFNGYGGLLLLDRMSSINFSSRVASYDSEMQCNASRLTAHSYIASCLPTSNLINARQVDLLFRQHPIQPTPVGVGNCQGSQFTNARKTCHYNRPLLCILFAFISLAKLSKQLYAA